jgi:DNA-binding MarR family transcriptional regulator
MEELGFVRFTVDGRIKYVELTEYGMEVVENLKELLLSLKDSLPPKYLEVIEAEEYAQNHSLNEESEKILGKIKNLRTKIDRDYAELVKSDADGETIRLRLGPFSREVVLIGKMIDTSEEPIHDDILIAYNDTEDVFNSILNREA